jgi:hypothetical protein
VGAYLLRLGAFIFAGETVTPKPVSRSSEKYETTFCKYRERLEQELLVAWSNVSLHSSQGNIYTMHLVNNLDAETSLMPSTSLLQTIFEGAQVERIQKPKRA